jgi:phosphoglycerol transferase MdoB-like AlkP superfamily enzyme
VKPVMNPNPGGEIQHFYARFLDRAAKGGFLLIILTFLLYVSGMLSPYVPLERLPHYWGRQLNEYLEVAHLTSGWSWLTYLHYGDFLTFLPIAGLAGISIFGYLCLVAKFFSHREPIMGWIALLETVILLLAASGILAMGGH